MAETQQITDTSVREPKQLPWAALAWFAGLLILAYVPILIRLVSQWWDDEDMGHGFFVPILACYIAWQSRDELLALAPKPNYLGLLLLLFASVQALIGSLGAELFLQRTAFIESVVGAILLMRGWPAIRVLFFPLCLLVFMVPIPAIIYNRITFPLQLFASSCAETVLELIGIPVVREGNILVLANQTLSVVEACSGIRSLLSLTFLSLIYAYFFDSKVWMRAALFVTTIPIAILANAGRVTITGILSEKVSPELAKGFFHTAEGWVIFMIALTLLLVAHKGINLVWGAIAKGKGEK